MKSNSRKVVISLLGATLFAVGCGDSGTGDGEWAAASIRAARAMNCAIPSGSFA